MVNFDEGRLTAVKDLGDAFYASAAKTSKFYGKEINGQLWNPWLFRRFLPRQLEEKLIKWKELQTVYSANVKAANYLLRTEKRIKLCDGKDLEEAIEFLPTHRLLPKAVLIFMSVNVKTSGIIEVSQKLVWEYLKRKNMQADEFLVGLGRLIPELKNPYYYDNVYTGRNLLTEAGFLNYKDTSILASKGRCIEEILTCEQYGYDGEGSFVYYASGVVNVLNSCVMVQAWKELNSLATLEAAGGDAFKERSALFPVSVFTNKKAAAYSDVLLNGMFSVNEKAFTDAYAKAGVYYWHKSKVWNGKESLEECQKILGWDTATVELELLDIADAVFALLKNKDGGEQSVTGGTGKCLFMDSF